jgi:hypothetical protein
VCLCFSMPLNSRRTNSFVENPCCVHVQFWALCAEFGRGTTSFTCKVCGARARCFSNQPLRPCSCVRVQDHVGSRENELASCVSLSVSLSLYLSFACLFVPSLSAPCLSVGLPVGLPPCLSVCLPVLPACLPACQSACLLACLSAYPSA